MTESGPGSEFSEYAALLGTVESHYSNYAALMRKWLEDSSTPSAARAELVDEFTRIDSEFFTFAQTLAQRLESSRRTMSRSLGGDLRHRELALRAGETDLYERVKATIADVGHLRVEVLKAMEIILMKTGEEISRIEASLRLKSRYNPLRETGNILNDFG